MKITMYELLGLVKDGKAPMKIRYQNKIYHIDELEHFYVNDDKKALLEYIFDYLNDYDALMSEVEILEEEKKIPEKLIKLNNVSNSSDLTALSQMQWENNKLIEKKINEIIDYLKIKGE